MGLMSASTQQLLDATNDAIAALTAALATGNGTVEYAISNRRHRTNSIAEVTAGLNGLYKARENLMRQLAGGRRPSVRVASLGRAGRIDR